MSKVKSSCLPAMSPFLIKFSFSKHFEAWHYPNTLMENHGKPTPTENQLVPRSLGSSQHPHPRVRRTGQHNRSRHRPSTGSPWECSFLATATASGIALGDIAWEYTTILRGMNMDEYSVNHLEMGRNKCSHDIMSLLKIHLGMDTGAARSVWKYWGNTKVQKSDGIEKDSISAETQYLYPGFLHET